jgi:phosphoadenosine phosphosulfate reductase
MNQICLFKNDYINIAIKRLKEFEPSEGYWLAFSGGKDSCVIKRLAELANVKFESHYNVTGIDHPELYYFIKKYHHDVYFDMYKKSMLKLIEEKLYPPTRIIRYCCSALKEKGGEGRFVITGVRWAESTKRKNRSIVENFHRNKKYQIHSNDNAEGRMMLENCIKKGKFILNPIIDWTDHELWNFIKKDNLKYCSLYDRGYKRLGCIGCPMSGSKQQKIEFKNYPKIRKIYIMAFEKMLKNREKRGIETAWKTAEDVMTWWLSDIKKDKTYINQVKLEEVYV